jgi:hypothetical protein
MCARRCRHGAQLGPRALAPQQRRSRHDRADAKAGSAQDGPKLFVGERERRLMCGLGLRDVRGGCRRHGATQLPDPCGQPGGIKSDTSPGWCREVLILLQKSFCTRDQNFFWLYRRLPCKYVGDLIVRRKTRWRPGNVIEATSIGAVSNRDFIPQVRLLRGNGCDTGNGLWAKR